MAEKLDQAVLDVAYVNALAQGLAMSLDGMEGELGKDARFYALRTCIDAIAEKSVSASEALDKYWLSQLEDTR